MSHAPACLSYRSEPSNLVSEEDSPRHDLGLSRRFKLPVVGVDDEALSATSSSSKISTKHSDLDKKLFNESAKNRKIFSKKNHQDSAPDLLETAAARLSAAGKGDKNRVLPKSRGVAATDACLVSLSDPCSPIASPTEEPGSSGANVTNGKNLKLNRAHDLRGFTPSSSVSGPKTRQLLPVNNDVGYLDVASSSEDGGVKPKTETISMIAARRASRIQRHDGGRLSISVNDLTDVGRANQTGSSLSFVSSVATHDGVVRLNTHHNNRRQDPNAAFASNNKKGARDRSPDDVSNVSVKAKTGRNGVERRRKVGGGARNTFESFGGADPNRPWRQQPPPQKSRIKPPNAGGRIWFPRDQRSEKDEPLQPLQSREAPPSTVAQNNAQGNGLTVVRRNRGSHLAAGGASNNSTPAGHQGAVSRKRNGRGGINAPAGFTSHRAKQPSHAAGSEGASSTQQASSDASGNGIAITGYALKNGDPF